MRLSATVAALGLLASCLLSSALAFAQGAALAGRVPSDKEGAMEGVVVSAKKVGPVTFWIGSNHGGSIIKVEPLD